MSRPVKSKPFKQFRRKLARTRSLLLLMEPLRVLFRQKLDSRTYAQGVQLGREISKRRLAKMYGTQKTSSHNLEAPRQEKIPRTSNISSKSKYNKGKQYLCR